MRMDTDVRILSICIHVYFFINISWLNGLKPSIYAVSRYKKIDNARQLYYYSLVTPYLK